VSQLPPAPWPAAADRRPKPQVPGQETAGKSFGKELARGMRRIWTTCLGSMRLTKSCTVRPADAFSGCIPPGDSVLLTGDAPSINRWRGPRAPPGAKSSKRSVVRSTIAGNEGRGPDRRSQVDPRRGVGPTRDSVLFQDHPHPPPPQTPPPLKRARAAARARVRSFQESITRIAELELNLGECQGKLQSPRRETLSKNSRPP